MVDSQMLGVTTAECMESLDRDHEDGSKVIAVMVICLVEPPGKEETRTRIYCSESRYWLQQGIMKVGQECLDDGQRIAGIGEEDNGGET